MKRKTSTKEGKSTAVTTMASAITPSSNGDLRGAAEKLR